MMNFREDMIQLSLKYPFIKKVVIESDKFDRMCDSFDKTLNQEVGTVRKHIADKDGSMMFEELYVESENKDAQK